ncbi:MAG TPA: nucleic acid-binding protein [Chloroflexota bacterium]|nr:nucleic acid-binding protein [Chloroflexota bacterium]
MPPIIILDTGPLSNCVVQVSSKPGVPSTPSQACRKWLTACERDGATILVSAIAYYEALREIERRIATNQGRRLKQYCFQPGRFIPLTMAQLDLAAELWGQTRRIGVPTAGDAALDGDVILCAQVRSLGLASANYVVATTNTRHLAIFVNAVEWQNIIP